MGGKISTWKDAPIICHRGNANQIRYHYTNIRIIKSRILTTPNADQGVGQQELSFVAAQNAKWYILEAVWQFHMKLNTLTIQSSNHAPWYLPKGTEDLWPHKNPHTDVYKDAFIIAKVWKQRRRHFINQRINSYTWDDRMLIPLLKRKGNNKPVKYMEKS